MPSQPLMITIPLNEPEELGEAIERKVRGMVGPNMFLESKRQNDAKWNYTFGMSYTEMIDDSRDTCAPVLCAREVRSLFSIDVSQNQAGKYAATLPSIEMIIETMNRKMNVKASKSEEIIVNKGYERFLQLGKISVNLAPIIRILRAVNDEGRVTAKDVHHRSGKVRNEQYLSFLTQIDYLKHEDNSYVKGSKFDKIGGPEGDPKLKALLAELIHSQHDYLQTYFHLTMMTPYVRLTNSYYYPSGTKGQMLRMLPDLLRKYQIRYYDVRKPEYLIKDHVADMRGAEILAKDGKYIIGENQLFQEYCSEAQC